MPGILNRADTWANYNLPPHIQWIWIVHVPIFPKQIHGTTVLYSCFRSKFPMKTKDEQLEVLLLQGLTWLPLLNHPFHLLETPSFLGPKKQTNKKQRPHELRGKKTSRKLTAFSHLKLTRNTAPRRPWVFCDQGCIIEDVLSAPANTNWFHKVFSLFNPWFTSRSWKTGISPR